MFSLFFKMMNVNIIKGKILMGIQFCDNAFLHSKLIIAYSYIS